jgi:hypothetical protein
MKPNSTAKEQSLNPRPVTRAQAQSTVAADQLDERVVLALHAAAEKKAIDPTVLDLREIASFTDFFFITSGANERQVQAISDEVYETLKKAGSTAARVEGVNRSELSYQQDYFLTPVL